VSVESTIDIQLLSFHDDGVSSTPITRLINQALYREGDKTTTSPRVGLIKSKTFLLVKGIRML
jgi:hypothetical protein